MKKTWAFAAAPLIVMALVLFAVPEFWAKLRGLAFLAVMLLLAVELAVIGWLINGRLAGAFIDNRNRLSLSKLQAGAWTVIVLAAFATAAAWNATGPGANYTTTAGLLVSIPGELLLAMGISATSLVATPALLSLKAAETPQDDKSGQTDPAGKTIVAEGKLANKSSPADASWSDLFTGEEVGNVGTPDLGKIQQVLISLVLLGAYAGYVYQNFALGPAHTDALPTLDKSFVWLLGISHASYLAYKAAPHTKSAD